MNANEKQTTLTRAGSATTRKLVLTAMFTCLAFVLNTFVYFPAMASYPLFKMFYGLDAQSPFYFIPFYIPSALVGASMGVVALLILKHTGVLNRMKQELER